MTDDRRFIAGAQAMSSIAVWIRQAAKEARQSDGFRKGSTHPTGFRW
jgi:hypothetical protein